MEKRQFVVLGAGNWFNRSYAKPLAKWQLGGSAFTYLGYYASGDDHSSAATLAHVDDFALCGATCLDLDNPGHSEKLEKLDDADAVFVITPDRTHCDEAARWLGRAKAIYVEKPFDTSDHKVRLLKKKAERTRTAIYGVDHYLIRARRMLIDRGDGHHVLKEEFDQHIEASPRTFTFHLLEPGGVDLLQRRASLQRGLIMDLFPHVLALVAPFGNPASAQLNWLQAGVFRETEALDLDGKLIPVTGREIFYKGRESFAHIVFHFTSWGGKRVNAEAFIGKCVGAEPQKSLVVTGGELNDKVIALNLQEPFSVRVSGGPAPENEEKLEKDPIKVLIDAAVRRRSPRLPLFNLDQAQAMVERLSHFTEPVEKYVKPRHNVLLPEYECGASLSDVVAVLDHELTL